MSLFMDVHDIEGGVSANDVAEAHQRESTRNHLKLTAIRGMFGVIAVAGTLGLTQNAAGANPCETDRQFAEANGCNDVYDDYHEQHLASLDLNQRVR